jgi:hypothetical protein
MTNKKSAVKSQSKERVNDLLPVTLHVSLLRIGIAEGDLTRIACVLVGSRSRILLGRVGGARRPGARNGGHVRTNVVGGVYLIKPSRLRPLLYSPAYVE